MTLAEHDRVTEPEPLLMVVELNAQLSPEAAENDRVTVPAKPFKGETVIVVGQETLPLQFTIIGLEGKIVKSWTV